MTTLKLGSPWVSWVDWPERQMGPGFWALGRRETNMCVYSQRLQSGGACPEEQMEGNRHI